MATVTKTKSVTFKVERYGAPKSQIPAEAAAARARQIGAGKKKFKRKPKPEADADVEAVSSKVATTVAFVEQPKSTALVVKASKATETKLAKYERLGATVKKTAGVFGIRKADIMHAVEIGDIDNAVMSFQRQAYMTVVNLIPIAEREYTKSKRDHQAYVLNALISQGRELAADLMASSDRAQLADRLISELLEPTFKAILQTMMTEQLKLKHLIDDKIKDEYRPTVAREIDDVVKACATTMNELYKVTAAQIRKHMLGE